MKLGIYGTGGTGRELYEIILDIFEIKGKIFDEIIFVDDITTDKELFGCRILNFNELLKEKNKDIKFSIAVGEPQLRNILRKKVAEAGYALITISHPSAVVSRYAKISNGVILKRHCIISNKAIINENCLIQANCIIGHDVVINEDCIISNFVSIGGFTSVGDRTYIAMNSSIRDRIRIGSDSIIGMGSVVVKDVKDNCVVFGNPGKMVAKNDSKKVFKQ